MNSLFVKLFSIKSRKRVTDNKYFGGIEHNNIIRKYTNELGVMVSRTTIRMNKITYYIILYNLNIINN